MSSCLTDDAPLPVPASPVPASGAPASDVPAAEAVVRSPGRTLAAALLGFFVITLDASVVTVALPSIGADLHGGLAALQWVVDGYTLVFAAFMLSTGALSDRIGAGRAFLAGLAVFTAASAACGCAPGLGVLIGTRVVQGAAASVMLPASLALVRQAYPDAGGSGSSGMGRARAVALWAAGGAVAVALGPVAGGALTSVWSWRGIFFINLPIGLLAAALLARTPRSPRRTAPLDVPGQLTAVLGLAALTFAVIEGGGLGAVAAAVAVAVLVCFFLIEARTAHPVVPLGLFRDRTVAVCVAVGAALSFAFYGMIFVLSLFFQQVRGQSALGAGLMFLPMTALIALVNVVAGRLAARFGPRLPMLAGQLLMIVGLLILLPVGAGTPAALLAVVMVPLGLGGALAVPPLTAALLDATPAERAGLAAGVLNAGRQIAGALAVAAFGALVARPDRFLPGLRTCLLLSAALLTVTALATLALRRPAAPHR
ncbi:MFS transporter, DHA2 family, methylenomycin A resistance protein [Actinacidiphila alni]|uniref:MFS transporter, DHA2 family, methylenomycin A resistance protein n=1 Tax=Actinacidiphila alni TaxID=380248 RepID=A0A1I2GK86_9ACTN|nr:MFS transporter [Actinacidiphila alni]SFF17031.1 MFS transporter, DHA2 family, methylenomycin A resistance protein [Actinacidiphila alni]